MMSSKIEMSSPPALALADRDDRLGRFADFTLGTAVVLWHLALAARDRRRRRTPSQPWSSTR